MSDRGMVTRRAFLSRGAMLAAAGVAAGGVVAGTRRLLAQQAAPGEGAVDSSNLFAMDQSASRPVRKPPKPGAHPVLTVAQRDDLEHRIRCQCGCTLDVYTCRTTDFSCQVSPAMHADVISLVEGGYDAQEIIDAFVGAYGEKALMAPTKDGFNLFGWVAPFVAIAIGAAAVAALLVRWRRASAPAVAAGPRLDAIGAPSDATDDELARLARAVRDDS